MGNRLKGLALAITLSGTLAGGLAAGTIIGAGPAQGSEVRTELPPRYDQPWLNRPCKWEDSIQCYWNAGTMGNGRGHSFYAIRLGNTPKGGVRVAIVYWDREYNIKNGYVVSNW